MVKCKVVNRPLTINGLTLQPGAEFSLPEEDAAALIERGRVTAKQRAAKRVSAKRPAAKRVSAKRPRVRREKPENEAAVG